LRPAELNPDIAFNAKTEYWADEPTPGEPLREKALIVPPEALHVPKEPPDTTSLPKTLKYGQLATAGVHDHPELWLPDPDRILPW